MMNELHHYLAVIASVHGIPHIYHRGKHRIALSIVQKKHKNKQRERKIERERERELYTKKSEDFFSVDLSVLTKNT